jgi:hypothetical protein
LKLERFLPPTRETALTTEEGDADILHLTPDEGTAGTAVTTHAIPTDADVDVDAIVVEPDPEYAAIAKQFRAKQVGAQAAVSIRGGRPVSGTVKAIAPGSIVLLRPLAEGSAEITLSRQDMAAVSRALFWEEDYVAYVMARRSAAETVQADAEEISRSADEYRAAFARRMEERREEQRDRLAALAEHRRRKKDDRLDKQRVRSGSMSMGEWMKSNGATENEMLKARQERVRQHENANPDM